MAVAISLVGENPGADFVQLKPVFSARYAEYAKAGVGIVSVENVAVTHFTVKVK